MKAIAQLNIDLDKFNHKLKENLVQAQKDTAKKIRDDAKKYSPKPNGEYAESIKAGETVVENDTIKTSVYTNMRTEDGYFIGRMIENGTGIYALEPHIGKTKTFFESGYQYWYVPTDKVKRPLGQTIVINNNTYYVARAQKPKPHFKPALNDNIETYRNNILEAIRRVSK